MSLIQKSRQTIQDIPQAAPSLGTEAASCGCGSACGCNSATMPQENSIQVVSLSTSQSKRTLSDRLAECRTMWQKIRGFVMLGIACIASPCCTVLFVPVFLALIAGTPAAVWLGHNQGWIYGALTLLSVVSFVMAFRWMSQSSRAASSKTQSTVITSSEINSQSL
jgi:hypothetical protein